MIGPLYNAGFKAGQEASKAENACLRTSKAELLEALKLATKELNAIRARDGAPQHIDWGKDGPMQIDGCSPGWWDELTEKCLSAIANAEKGT